MSRHKWLYDPHEEHRTVGWLELFFDLVFVATLIELGNLLSNDVSLTGFFRFVMLFVPVWWAWAGNTFFANRFLVDDPLHRFFVFIQMLGLSGMAISIQGAFDDLGNQFVLGYILTRTMLLVQNFRMWMNIEEVRPLVSGYISGFGAGIIAWFLSLFVEGDIKYVLWAIGIVIELGTPFTPHLEKWQMTFAPHVEHMVERYGIFSIIVLGESFLKVIDSQAGSTLSAEFTIIGFLLFSVTCSIWWLYFDDITDSEINRGAQALYIWIYFHLPLAIGITAFGVAAKKVLEQPFDEPLKEEYRLLLIGVLIIYLIAVTVIDEVTTHEERSNQSRAVSRAISAVALGLLAFIFTDAQPALIAGIVAVIFFIQVAINVVIEGRFTMKHGHGHSTEPRFPTES